MDVMMIGHSGAGKTTYMAAMYDMLSEGIDGFSIEAIDYRMDEQLKTLSNQIRRGYYPSSTDIHSSYEFMLQYYNEDIIPFTWYDYRGGALLQNSNHSSEVRDLIYRVNNANALIVFFDGEKLMRNDFEVMREYRRTQFCIQQAISRIPDDTFLPVSLVMTKADTPGLDLQRSPMYEPIQRMIQAIANNEKTVGLFTSTVINNEQTANVQFPLLSSIFYGLIKERNEIAYAVNQHTQKANDYKNKANIFDDIWSIIADEDSYRDLASREFEKTQRKYRIYQELVEHADGIVKIIEDAASNEYIVLL